MEIQIRKTGDIKPYQKNARKNDEAVKYVAESIRQFGFRVPIVIDKNNIIVCGHTRHKAAKQLGLEEVPCVVADDLTEEQIKAFRLADNKVSEKAEWDFDLLNSELDELLDFDMTDFGFEKPEEESEPKENERVRTGNSYNLTLINLSACEGRFQMPKLEPEHFIPDRLIGYNYAATSKDKNTGIHFYIDDYQFERIWTSPEKYFDILNEYDCILTPDFSLYMDMPYTMKAWNVFRSRLVGQIYQNRGMIVIPTVSWAEKETFDFCFDGLPEKATLSISTIGVKKDKEAFEIWESGVKELIRRKKPKTLLIYGGKVDFDYGNIKTVYYDNETTERMKGANNED